MYRHHLLFLAHTLALFLALLQGALDVSLQLQGHHRGSVAATGMPIHDQYLGKVPLHLDRCTRNPTLFHRPAHYPLSPALPAAPAAAPAAAATTATATAATATAAACASARHDPTRCGGVEEVPVQRARLQGRPLPRARRRQFHLPQHWERHRPVAHCLRSPAHRRASRTRGEGPDLVGAARLAPTEGVAGERENEEAAPREAPRQLLELLELPSGQRSLAGHINDEEHREGSAVLLQGHRASVEVGHGEGVHVGRWGRGGGSSRDTAGSEARSGEGCVE